MPPWGSRALRGWPVRCVGSNVRPALRDRAGAVAIVTAVCAPVLLLIVGFAVDYGYASYVNQRLAKAADAAVLTAVSQSAATAGGGYGNTAWLQAYGTNVFRGNIAQLRVSGVNFTLNVSSDGSGGVVASGTYKYASPTFFGGIIGRSTIPLSGSVRSTAHPVTYLNYYILTDTSQSMGIGATAADMQNLYDRVAAYGNGSGGEAGCVFGCHVRAPSNAGGLQKYTNEDLAHNMGRPITLRIDAAVSAIQGIISSAATIAGTTKNIRIGLYTLQADPTTGSYLGTVSSPSSNYATLNSAAATIGLGNNTSAGIGDSSFYEEISAFNQKLPSNGSGASAVSPRNYVFIVTDGLQDTYSSSCGYTHCTSAFSAAICSALKKKAVVGVIYTTYLPIYNQNNPAKGYEAAYRDLVLPYAGQIAPNLQNCATSSDYYFEAGDGPAIISAMQALFLKTQPTTARLTQ